MDPKISGCGSLTTYLTRLATVLVAVVVVVVAAVDAVVVVLVVAAVVVVLLEAVEVGVGFFGPFAALLLAPLLPGAV